MAVDGGAGNAISFSEIQSFYGGSSPISISEYNRGGSLVPSTFAGSDTATTGTTTQTVDDLGVTVTAAATGYTSFSTTITQGNSGFSGSQSSGNWNVIRENAATGIGTWTARVLNAATTLTGSCDKKALTVTKNGTSVVSLDNNGGSWSVSCAVGDVIVWTCSAGAGGGGTINRSQSWNWGSGGASIQYTSNTNGGNSGSITAYNVTFVNNSSTGDTYTITSGSTGSETEYSPSESQTVKSNNSSNSWVIAYDNVSGAGPGSAGDINVTETSAFTGTLGSVTSRLFNSVSNASSGSSITGSYTVLASDSVLILNGGGQNQQSGADGDGVDLVGSWSTSGVINISPVASGQAKFYKGPAYQSGDSSNLTFSGTIGAGTFTMTGSVGSAGGSVSVSTRRRAEQFTTVFTNSSGSESYTLESSTTGGAAVMSPGSTRNVQTTNSSGSSWAIHFDTSSGNCNTNLPTAISSGNAVNLDLFNAPGTAVG